MKILAIAFALACVAVTTPVRAQSTNEAIIEQMVAERAATLATLSRRFEARDQELLQRIAARARQIGAALRAADAAMADRVRLEAELTALAAECASLTERLGADFPDFGADLAAYRGAVTSLASSPDPGRVAALERYAAGDRIGALTVLAALQEAETRAVASGWREIGALALDMRDRGERTTGQVTAIFVVAHRLDPADGAATRQFVTLLTEEHRYVEAQGAIQAHQRNGLDRLAQARALVLSGGLEGEFGEHRRSRASLRQAVALYEALRADNSDDQTLRSEWLDANHKLLLSFSSTAGLDEAARRAYHAEYDEVETRLAQSVLHPDPYAALGSAAAIFDLTAVSCGMAQRVYSDADRVLPMRNQCLAGVAELQRRHPGSYFAQRAEIGATLLEMTEGPQRMVEVLPRVITMTTALVERDPDSMLLLEVLANFMVLYEAMTRAVGDQGDRIATLGGLRRAIAISEEVAARGRLSPREQLRLASFYSMAETMGITPAAGLPYGHRAQTLYERILAEAPADAEIRVQVQGSRANWARMAAQRQQQ